MQQAGDPAREPCRTVHHTVKDDLGLGAWREIPALLQEPVQKEQQDTARVRDALMGGFAASRILELHGQRMISRDFQPGGPARYQLKDTSAARDVAHGLGLELPMLNLADQLFSDLIAHGGGDLDHSALLIEMRRRNGLET